MKAKFKIIFLIWVLQGQLWETDEETVSLSGVT